jgi:hypothetical protein
MSLTKKTRAPHPEDQQRPYWGPQFGKLCYNFFLCIVSILCLQSYVKTYKMYKIHKILKPDTEYKCNNARTNTEIFSVALDGVMYNS